MFFPVPQPVGSRWQHAKVTVAALVLVASSLLGGPLVPSASAQTRGANELTTVSLASLPEQARDTDRLIRAGGPFPFEKDGTVFGNRERLLPRKPRGHYREYTVRTPGSRDRGARRIVCGGEMPREPEACFYTEDHYASFRRIAP